MNATRAAAAELAGRGEIEITQKGNAVDPSSFKGPIRLRLKTTMEEIDGTPQRKEAEDADA